mmetsp:Transcript_97800/g.262793  ORF Transcript_97800/g.262793 Transcript_97800/m.262793 type:complete len:434 (+) Transcript_97800:96-1397(+)
MITFPLRGSSKESTGIRLWDPRAHSVWWVSQKTREPVAMTRKADSVWDLTSHALGDAPYAFIAEWTQEWRISGQDIRCDEGEPSEEAAESVEVSSDVPAGADEQVALNGFDSAADSASVSAAGTVKKVAKQKSPLQRLGKDEFVVEAQDMGQFAVDATGTRVNLIIADRIIVEGVTVAASDGSWGPVVLQCAEPELALPSAGDGSAAGDSSRVPAIWIGNAVDLEFGTIKQVELVVRVRRRDWRIDPSSLGLCQGTDSGALPGGGCARPPPGSRFLECAAADAAVAACLRPVWRPRFGSLRDAHRQLHTGGYTQGCHRQAESHPQLGLHGHLGDASESGLVESQQRKPRLLGIRRDLFFRGGFRVWHPYRLGLLRRGSPPPRSRCCHRFRHQPHDVGSGLVRRASVFPGYADDMGPAPKLRSPRGEKLCARRS